METIVARAIARLKAARRLQARRGRRQERLFLVEGEDLVEEGLAAGILPVETFVAADRPPPEELLRRVGRSGPVRPVADDLLAEVGSLGHPARIVAVFRMDDLPRAPADADLAVYLHRVVDPGNVGTVVRAAGALGPATLALSPGSSDPLSAKGVRASMGAVFRVPIEHGAEPPAVGTRVALVAGAERPLWDVDRHGPVTRLVGAERAGLPPELVDAADVACAIPQAAAAESLNAAAAATVALYEAVRQRSGLTATSTESGSPSAGARSSNQP